MIKFEVSIFDNNRNQIKTFTGDIHEIKTFLERSYIEYPSLSWGMLRCSSLPNNAFLIGHAVLNKEDIERCLSHEGLIHLIKQRQYDLSIKKETLMQQLNECVAIQDSLYQLCIS